MIHRYFSRPVVSVTVFPLFGPYPSLRAFAVEVALYTVAISIVVGVYRKGMAVLDERGWIERASTRWLAQVLLVVLGILLVNLLTLLLVTIWPDLSILDF